MDNQDHEQFTSPVLSAIGFWLLFDAKKRGLWLVQTDIQQRGPESDPADKGAATETSTFDGHRRGYTSIIVAV